MSHELRRLLRYYAQKPLFLDPREAEKIVAVLLLRAAHGPRSEPFRVDVLAADRSPARERKSNIVVLNLQGSILPRTSGVEDMSGPPAASLERFGAAFDEAARSAETGAIVINVDSPGGTVDLVPETAAKVFAARDASRPIIAVANTLMASAAYWIGAAANELVVTESGEVGSIGVWSMHEDISEALKLEGVNVTLISEGARKVEGNPFEPLGDSARKHLQDTTRHYYNMFVRDVAQFREVDEAVVRADPDSSEQHFGGGRTYPARVAVKLGMADRVESLESVLHSLQTGKRPIRNRRSATDLRRRRLALI